MVTYGNEPKLNTSAAPDGPARRTAARRCVVHKETIPICLRENTEFSYSVLRRVRSILVCLVTEPVLQSLMMA